MGAKTARGDVYTFARRDGGLVAPPGNTPCPVVPASETPFGPHLPAYDGATARLRPLAPA
jgi:hypothetical protein